MDELTRHLRFDIELLALRLVRHAPGGHVRVPREPDEQVGDDREGEPDQEYAQSMARTGGRPGAGGVAHEPTTVIWPVM